MKLTCITTVFLLIIYTSCKKNDIFEKEMYKNQVALISKDPNNIFEEIVQLTGEEEIGYIAASVGGTHAPQKDLVIELEEDEEPLNIYNWSQFDANESMYAKLLPKNRYEIADNKIIIKAGERTGRTMIKLYPDGLSPDSSYFISLNAKGASNVEVNPKKKTILFQVLIKNDYASQAENSFYTMTGLINNMPTAANKELFPLTYNSVRMIAGNETFQPNEAAINKTSLILEIDENNKVTVKSYKGLEVTQLDGDPLYPNIFKIEEAYGRRTNVFLLSYKYTIGKVTNTMKERVEMQVR